MPEPIDYQALLNLQTALRGMATASGYHHTIASAAVKFDIDHDVESLVEPDGPRPFVIIEKLSEEWAMVEMPNGVKIQNPIRIHWVDKFTPAADTSKLQKYLRGCADVERAIAPDPGRGGFATNTTIVNRSWNTEANALMVWAHIDISMPIRRTFGQPDA
jgi:hypothetical protein